MDSPGVSVNSLFFVGISFRNALCSRAIKKAGPASWAGGFSLWIGGKSGFKLLAATHGFLRVYSKAKML